MNLSDLKPPAGQKKERKRIGRGMGSGHGKTATRGSKGQRAGTGFGQKRGFEGGQMPLHRRIPKRGFHNPFGTAFSVVNVEQLNAFTAGDTVTPDVLRARGFVRRANDSVKILGDGELKTKLTVRAHAFSESAKQKITAAGGSFEVVA